MAVRIRDRSKLAHGDSWRTRTRLKHGRSPLRCNHRGMRILGSDHREIETVARALPAGSRSSEFPFLEDLDTEFKRLLVFGTRRASQPFPVGNRLLHVSAGAAVGPPASERTSTGREGGHGLPRSISTLS